MAQNTGHKPGGGLHSRNVRHTAAPKSEPKPYAKNPGGISQYGGAQGNHVTTHGGSATGYKGDPVNLGRGYANPVGPTSFNNIGPGKGRDVHASGSQGVHGSTNPGRPGLPSTKGQWPD